MPNRITQKFQELKESKKKAFIVFITAGDPNLKATRDLVLALEKNGADIIELGVPFSDPLADGPTIQAASQRSLKNNVNLNKILNLVAEIRKSSQIPIALMSYYNPIFKFGEKKFIEQAVSRGVDGVIVPDLPLEEGKELSLLAKRNGVVNILFLSLTTTVKRMKRIVDAASGFIYFVSLTGTTGARESIPLEVIQKIKAVKKLTDKPVCVGFGISTPEHVRLMNQAADGVIVGSAVVNQIHANAADSDLISRVSDFVKNLKG